MGKTTRIFSATALALALAGSGVAQASFLVPQTHHPGVFFEKYAPGSELPYFDGARVDGTNPVTVTYEEFRQRVLPDTFYLGGGPFGLPAAVWPYDGSTLVWGYNVGGQPEALWPGVTIEAERGTPTEVTYVNNLVPSGDHLGPELQRYLTIDQTIHWANPTEVPGPPISRLELPPYAGPQPVVSHLHGGEVPSAFDGAPNQWFTADGIQGPGYRTIGSPGANAATYQYPNDQEATTLWFHDHTLGITRINVYAGVAAYYFLRDPAVGSIDNGDQDNDGDLNTSEQAGELQVGPREVEFVIQDRMFDIVGNLLFPDGFPFFVPNAQHPFWNPEFLGDVMTVNGRAWPFLNVDAQRYRIRFLNGSNARFYNLSLSGGGKGKGKGKGNKSSGASFWVIGTDGGLLDNPVQTGSLLIAPGERYDVIVDFAGLEGQTLTLLNDAKTPYPFGATADPQTVGQIAQFRVTTTAVGVDETYDPANDLGGTLRASNPIEQLDVPDVTRQLTLNEIPGPFGPLDAVLNNTRWGGLRDDGTKVAVSNAAGPQGNVQDTGSVAGVTDYVTELPQVGSTEVWEIINLTGDAHPIHLHLVQFQVMNRQEYNVGKYTKEYERNFPGGAAANPNQGIFIPHFGPPNQYNVENADFAIGGNPAVGPYLNTRKGPKPPEAYEVGWKDTVIALPKQVTRIKVRFARQDWTAVAGTTPAPGSEFSFDPTAVGDPLNLPGGSPTGGVVLADGTGAGPDTGGGAGYVWHCHIIDHEDNEMMRPLVLVNNPYNELDSP